MKKTNYHNSLSGYFTACPHFYDGDLQKKPHVRKCAELPYQLSRARLWEDLPGILCDVFFIEARAIAGLLELHQDDFKILLDHFKNKTDSEAFSLVNDFYTVFRRQKHILRDHPSITFQQFYNELQWSCSKAADVMEASRKEFLEKGRKFLHQYRVPGTEESHLVLTMSRQESEKVFCCSVSPDGSRVVAGSYRSAVIWDVDTGKQVAVLQDDEIFRDFIYRVFACAYSPDGRHIVTGSGSVLRLWDAGSGNQVTIDQWGYLTKDQHKDDVTACSFSPDSKLIVTGSRDTTIKVWNTLTGELLLTFKGHDAPVTSCSFSPDGEEIVSGSIRNTNTYGGVLKTWDIKTGREILTFNLQSGDVLSCAFSPDGGKVVSCGSNRKITVWNAFTCEKIYSVPNPVKEIRFCSFSPDGKMIIAGGSGNNIRMWEADSGKEVSVFNGHTGPVSCGSFLPDSTHFVSGSHDGTLKLWNTGTRARRTYLNGPGYGNTALCDFSKDNSLSICMFKAKKHPCIICNAMSGKEIRTFRHRRRELRSFVREAKKRVLKLGSWSGFLKTQPYSPDGHSIVTKKDYRSSDADIIEKDTRKAVMTLSGHTGYVTACSWSPDGRKIVTGSEDNTLRIWDAGNGKEIKSLGRHHGLSVPYCNFSSDGKWIVAVSEYYENAVKIWDPATGEESASFILESGISTLSQSGCGRNIACGDEDGNYYLLRLTGFCFDNPVITLQRKPGTKRKWPGFAVARQNKEEIFSLCPVCGERTVGNELVVNKIEELNKKYGLVPGDSPCLKLPAGAWEDPGLISSCPGCWTVLKVNPFIAQGDD